MKPTTRIYNCFSCNYRPKDELFCGVCLCRILDEMQEKRKERPAAAAMKYVTEEQVKKAKEWDLKSYLERFEPEELIHISGKYFSTRTHDSVRIWDGRWKRYATGQFGDTALQYLTYVENKPYIEIVELLSGVRAQESEQKHSVKTQKRKTNHLILPGKNDNNDRAIEYLRGRGISPKLVAYLIRSGKLYESSKYHNAVFVQRDHTGKPVYAVSRGTGEKRFYKEVAGSNKRFSFSLSAAQISDTVYVFEGAIDMLSFCTLMEISGYNMFGNHCLSLGGVQAPKDKAIPMKPPVALSQYLESHPRIGRINLMLDNDQIGQRAADHIIRLYSNRYFISNHTPKNCKDINDFLLCVLEKRHALKEREVKPDEIRI